MRRILFSETDFASLPNPPAGFKYIGFDGPNFSEKDENGSTTPTGGGGGLTDITYSAIRTAIDDNGLIPGSYYRITDFMTCYDQPNYNISKSAITQGIYKTSSVHPIIVLATSVNTLAPDAYQPDYPMDKIKYDVTYSSTYTSGGTAYGRIVERIDEYNNRTDYDHHEVLFKRYRAFYHEFGPLRGEIQINSNGVVTGEGTYFEDDFSVGDYLAIPDTTQYVFEITGITSSLTMSAMTVTGSSIPSYTGEYHRGYRLDTDNSSYLSYFPNNIDGQNDYSDRKTFPDNEDVVNNYIGDFYNLAIDWDEETFDLPNNVFGEDCTNNVIGNGSMNNTFDTDVEENVIGHYFRNNIIRTDVDDDGNDFDDNKIGDFFQNNRILNRFSNNNIDNSFENNYILGSFQDNNIGDNFDDNKIDNDFYDNKIGSSFNNNIIWSNFEDNIIGNDYYDNTIYSEFYDNQIGNEFQFNTLGDRGNLGEIEFYRNKIGNNFNENEIRGDFQNNQIGNQFNENNVYGDFYKNVIGNGFQNNNNIGHDFYGNHIGNGFNDNDYISDYFQNNKIGEYFQDNNYIYPNFKENSIGNDFEENTLGDTQYFTWNVVTLENLTSRNYQSFDSFLGYENVGNVILGKELIMHFTRSAGSTITSGDLIVNEIYEITNYQGTDDFTDVAEVVSGVMNTNGCVFLYLGGGDYDWSSGSELTELTSYDEYHLVRFTQWTQSNNGGGFSYERKRIWLNGMDVSGVENTVYFTKTNYQSEVDVIIEGRLEITRGDNRGIYNKAVENSWNGDGPSGTEWNSVYTQTDFSFQHNEIGNEFKGNEIKQGFYANKIGYGFASNNLSGDFDDNVVGNYFYSNDLDSFYSNKLGNYYFDNEIGDNFTNNEIGDNFINNTISNDFSNNKIGRNFYSNQIAEGFGFGGNESKNNVIQDYFQNNSINEYFYNNKVASYFENNTVGYYFQRNNIDTPIFEEDFTTNYGNIVAVTYTSSGTTSTPGFYNNLTGTTEGFGLDATFGVTVSGGTISSISLINPGNQYEVGDVIIIPGNSIEGQTGVIETFTLNGSPTGLIDGTYNGLTAIGGSGSNATFNIAVNLGAIDVIALNSGGGGYIIGNTVSILGGDFGGTNSVNDITITVDSLYSDDITITVTEVSATPSVYESYDCQIFERKGGDFRLSFYDENDILTIKNIKE
jgi:hypothetical protein